MSVEAITRLESNVKQKNSQYSFAKYVTDPACMSQQLLYCLTQDLADMHTKTQPFIYNRMDKYTLSVAFSHVLLICMRLRVFIRVKCRVISQSSFQLLSSQVSNALPFRDTGFSPVQTADSLKNYSHTTQLKIRSFLKHEGKSYRHDCLGKELI